MKRWIENSPSTNESLVMATNDNKEQNQKVKGNKHKRERM